MDTREVQINWMKRQAAELTSLNLDMDKNAERIIWFWLETMSDEISDSLPEWFFTPESGFDDHDLNLLIEFVKIELN